ncbi:hypothetical protein JTE90_010465 [Oedothorax gibbosus]|uniref:Uncharacterized protein n=1 Tax=Oedothorax gibbosus TaxID=931172 RepID=A0AAV6W2T3_9ARAC|nr:hypothetical protein JTE90_010465 [Oedothorax gibbosus]
MNVLLSTRGKGARLDRSWKDRIVRAKSTSAPSRSEPTAQLEIYQSNQSTFSARAPPNTHLPQYAVENIDCNNPDVAWPRHEIPTS